MMAYEMTGSFIKKVMGDVPSFNGNVTDDIIYIRRIGYW